MKKLINTLNMLLTVYIKMVALASIAALASLFVRKYKNKKSK